DLVVVEVIKVTPSVDAEVDLVEGPQRGLPLSCEHATSPQLIEGDVEAAQPGEQVNETEGPATNSHRSGPVRSLPDQASCSWLAQTIVSIPAAEVSSECSFDLIATSTYRRARPLSWRRGGGWLKGRNAIPLSEGRAGASQELRLPCGRQRYRNLRPN